MAGVHAAMLASTAPRVSITSQFASDTATSPADATATYALTSTGNAQVNGSNVEVWLRSGVNSDYEVRATLVSGTSPSGPALGSWHLLSTTRTWTQTEPGLGTTTCDLTIEIRDASTLNVLDSASVTLEANVIV